MNKTSIISIIFFTLINIVKAQESNINWLIGRWQIDQAELTSMNFDMYNFHKDGTFVFAPNAYNGLNRIIEVRGIYLLQGDTILLTPKFTKEVFGGYLVRSEITTLSDTWEIIEGKIKQVRCKKIITQKAFIHYNPNEKALQLDNYKYYKIE